ncbi:MAG: hypothetical protein KDA87_27830, partial [Planctomycetales bacterium]|nr:hypothetical protein [Planctomycetales bacterium]
LADPCRAPPDWPGQPLAPLRRCAVQPELDACGAGGGRIWWIVKRIFEQAADTTQKTATGTAKPPCDKSVG